MSSSSSSSKGLFDLESHFAMYGAYHSNPVNIVIHTIFVWPIFLTALVPWHYYAMPSLIFNPASIIALIYALFYLALDRRAGSLAAVLCFLSLLASHQIATRLPFSTAWKVVLAAQLLCWTCQFIGHGAFEKRAPALLDNLSQALLMAPFFVLLEVLQHFFGYEPYPGFHAKVNASIAARRKEWQDQKKKKHT